jgi:hypothetical protein
METESLSVRYRAMHTLDDGVRVVGVRRGQVRHDAEQAEVGEQGLEVRAVVAANRARERDVLKDAGEKRRED